MSVADARNLRRGVSGWWPVAVPAVVVLALAWGVIGLESVAPAGYFERPRAELNDQTGYHLPVVERFAGELPSPDLVSYPSATTPGYHLVMSVVWRGTGGSVVALRGVNALIGAGLVLTLGWWLARSAGAARGALLAMPLALSPYVVGGSAWLTTDNLAWLFVVLALGSVVGVAVGPGRVLAGGVFAALAVLTRQVHLWVIAPVGLAAVLASPLARALPRWVSGEGGERGRWSNLWAGVAAALPALAVVGGFALAWGGLVPAHPEMRAKHASGVNPASVGLALSLCGVFGVFLLPVVWGVARRVRAGDAWVWVSAGAGLVCAVAVPTAWERRVRDYGWFWRGVVRPAGEVAERSVAMAVLAPLGALVLLVLVRGARESGRGRDALVMLGALAGWCAAQSANTMAWQRYAEPMVLIVLAVLASLAVGDRAVDRRAWLGVVLLVLMQAGASVGTIALDFARGWG